MLHTPVSVWDMAGCALIVVMIFLVTEREPPALDAALEAAPRPHAEAYDDPPLFAGLRLQAGVLHVVSPSARTSTAFRHCSTGTRPRLRSASTKAATRSTVVAPPHAQQRTARPMSKTATAAS
ncbi:MAG: hypothetical protein ACLSVD_17330 [Eggerthellaceae bacterium]